MKSVRGCPLVSGGYPHGRRGVPQPEGAPGATPTAVGDEGGFAPALNGTEDAIESILEAIKMAGYKPGRKCEGGDVSIGMDCASSEFYADGV